MRHGRYRVWLAVLAGLVIIAVIPHYAGWLAGTAVIAVLAYQAGKRNTASRIRGQVARLRVNSQYGKPRVPTRPRQVTVTDAVSAYPADLATRPVSGPNPARSLAQRNRHLNRQLDMLQAKLEDAMKRADQAEQSARQAWDESNQADDKS